jgi:hypothetical protein
VAHLADSSSQDCLYTLNSNISSAGITLSGSDKLKVPNCSIYDNASINMNGSTSITAMGVGEQGTGTGNITPAPTTGMVPVGDPLAYLPTPSAPLTACIPDGGTSLPPGHYCKISAKHGNVTLTGGGLYYVDGDVCAGSSCGNNTISGSNVTIFLKNGGVSVTGSGAITLSAEMTCTPPDPSTGVCPDGTYHKVLFFQDRADSSPATISGAASTSLTGILYLPTADITLSGGSSVPLNVGIVVSTLSSNGSISLNGLPTGGGIGPITAATLAE